MSQPAKCFVCGHISTEFVTKGMWVGGKWYCPSCVERLSERKPTDLAYRFECFTCEFYRINQYGGLSLEGEPENPRYICLKFQARERCIFDEPLKPLAPKAASSQGGSTISAIIAASGPAPQEQPTPKLVVADLVGPASPLPARPHVESPAPNRKPEPRRQRRQT